MELRASVEMRSDRGPVREKNEDSVGFLAAADARPGIDGVYAGDYDREISVGWDKPFAVEVTGKLTSGRHHLAIRVHNVTAAGGIWKPVRLIARK